ncbi:MAG: aminoacetone oxidase family FAD-binding enzyme, partial [Prevotella sp.]|nr:aminoacetone oxidase family FAD-binding enzyme [Prevotella sp.]
LLKRLFKVFGPQDAYKWFEHRGVRLVTQEDQCVFPASQDSHTIIDCFTKEARRMGVVVRTGCKIETLEQLADFDFIAVTTGGSPRAEGLEWLRKAGHEIEQPVPSLFTFNIKDPQLCQLMGTVVENASVQLPGTKLRASGPLLITHWGMSGPAILKLSSYAARLLSERNYQHQLGVNWTGHNENEVANELTQIAQENAQKQVASYRPYALPQRLWSYLSMKCMGEKSSLRWGELGKKNLNRLTNILCNDAYLINGKGTFRDEFVTCGGISLGSIQPTTLESRSTPHLYFAGEVLDIDGVTGGFNFQAAWTTAFVVAQSIAQASQKT